MLGIWKRVPCPTGERFGGDTFVMIELGHGLKPGDIRCKSEVAVAYAKRTPHIYFIHAHIVTTDNRTTINWLCTQGRDAQAKNKNRAKNRVDGERRFHSES